VFDTVGDQQQAARSSAELGGRRSFLVAARNASPLVVFIGLSVIVVGSVLALGAVHVPVLLALLVLSVGIALVSGVTRPFSFRQSAFWVSALLSIYCVLQALPLPLAWLNTLSPRAAEVWRNSLHPFGQVVTHGALSVDPGASWLEATKYALYAAVFLIAAQTECHFKRQTVATVVFISAFVLAAVTGIHRLVDAEAVYGFYRPRDGWFIAPLINTNCLAGYLNLGVFCGVAVILSPRPRVPPLLVAVGVACIIAVSIMARSRAGLASLAIGFSILAIYLVVSRLGRWRVGLTLAGIVAGVIFAALALDARALTEMAAEGMVKLQLISWTFELAKDHLAFGVGRGAFATAFPPYRHGGGNVVFIYAENFVMQWVTEWGLPVAFLALLMLSISFLPDRTTWRKPHRLAMGLGVLVLLIQNLLDLALEIPAVMIALVSVLGGLAARPRKRGKLPGTHTPSDYRRRTVSRNRIVTLCALTVLLIVGVTGAVRGQLDFQTDRLVLREEALSEASRLKPGEFLFSVRSAIVRHPADAYPYLIGAMAAPAAGRSPMAFLSRALERDPQSGKTHFLAAKILRKNGATGQALMHLRWAQERDTALMRPACELVKGWGLRYDALLEMVPPGSAGVDALIVLASAADRQLQELLLQEALHRNPLNLEANVLIAAMKLASSQCIQDKRCRAEIEARIQAVKRLEPLSSKGIELEARLLTSQGNILSAAHLLESSCARFAEPMSCHWQWLEAARQLGPEQIEQPAAAYLESACRLPDNCAAAEEQVADIFFGLSQWGRAASHYEHAARQVPTSTRWLGAAKAYEAGGYQESAIQARRKAESLTGRGSADLGL